MPVVVFIGGVPNAGKSTIAAGLACSYPRTLFIDGDFVLSEEEEREITSLIQAEQWSCRTRKIIKIISEKTSAGMNAIIAWPLLQDTYTQIRGNLPENIDLFYIFLNPNLDVLSQNRATRPLTAWDKTRATEMHAEGYAGQDFCDLVIDNSNQLPFDTVQAIRTRLLDEAFGEK